MLLILAGIIINCSRYLSIVDMNYENIKLILLIEWFQFGTVYLYDVVMADNINIFKNRLDKCSGHRMILLASVS